MCLKSHYFIQGVSSSSCLPKKTIKAIDKRPSFWQHEPNLSSSFCLFSFLTQQEPYLSLKKKGRKKFYAFLAAILHNSPHDLLPNASGSLLGEKSSIKNFAEA